MVSWSHGVSDARARMSDAAGQDNAVLPFTVESLDLRGRVVRLGSMLDSILNRHAYPEPVARLLGEALALTALLGSSLKLSGSFQLQARTDGVVSLLVVDYDLPDRMRAYARFDADSLAANPEATPADLLGQGHLGLTIDQGPNTSRYQGLVALTGQGFEAAAHQYFTQSEQIPTRVRLAAGTLINKNDHEIQWRAGGMIAQFLPTSIDRLRQADLPPGDAPHGADIIEHLEDDLWIEARALTETVEDHELLDPHVSSEELLFRLFHERDPRVFEAQPLLDRCRCSTERILTMIEQFSESDRRAMVADDGSITVTCEFCSTHYHIDPASIGLD
jgi:molecular chaperone Hsp33